MFKTHQKADNHDGLRNSSTESVRDLAERSLALGGLIALAPVLGICALGVRLSSKGAILFRQTRIGINGKPFTLYKFRTMRENTRGISVTADGDPRITAIGKFLRKTKLDELPELYNILRGEMAFVGPRPEVAEFVDLENPSWREVLTVRPGITDPITIEFRNEENLLAGVENKEKFYRENIQPYKLKGYIEYLKKRSLFYDFKVILKTLKVVVFPQSAPSVRFEN